MKKTIALILCTLMCIGCLAACGNSAAPTATEAPAASGTSASTPAEPAATVDPALEEEYYFTMGSTMTSRSYSGS